MRVLVPQANMMTKSRRTAPAPQPLEANLDWSSARKDKLILGNLLIFLDINQLNSLYAVEALRIIGLGVIL
jgi:hypothetical protein